MAEYTHGKILPVEIEEEMKRSYIDYAMSVIVSRALPDVRDGLKPVHRRILYAMYEGGNTPEKPYRKSARVVGDVLGRYHPHGDVPVYDALVRMAQDFAIRYPLVDGHGNFGSLDGDPPAAMRYTEVRMTRLTMELMADIEKKTVDFQPNFDETMEEPTVLPSRFPNLLVNGSAGIAVGMATNIPPHNLREVIDAVVMMIEKPDVTTKELMLAVKGPDFPTGGLILGREGIKEAYETGRGIVIMRAQARIEVMNNGRSRILVTEIPYQVNKARLIERIAELVRDRKLEGISDLRDESDRDGLRMVIELKREANANVILNQLYKFTQLQESFGIIMLALVDNHPRVLNLRDVIYYYLQHQKEVVTRRTRFDLEKAEARAHILEGLRIALDNIDRIIEIIRGSRTVDVAREGLMQEFGLSEIQAQAILDMRLQRLTGLEREKIEEEYQDLLKTIEYLRAVLANERMLLGVIKKEILDIKAKFGDERRTRIVASAETFEAEDLIADEDAVITLTHVGYIKRLPLSTYRSQRRGGRGVTGMNTREEDFVEHLFITTTHHFLLFFSNRGKAYRIKVYEIPEAGRQAKGTALVNLIQLGAGEKITAVIPVRDFAAGELVFATRSGMVKKTDLQEFENIRKGGLIALDLADGDELISARLIEPKEELILVTRQGQSVRFASREIRLMGRIARGVIGIRLDPGDELVGMETVQPAADLLVVTTNGYGKRTPLSEYRSQSRAGKGIKAIRLTKRNGQVAGIKVVREGNEVMVISAEGVLIRLDVKDISMQGRDAQGVTLMKLDEKDSVVAVARVVNREEE